MSDPSNTLDLALFPRDGLFFKDGRGWFANASGQACALAWPFPSTVRGALRTAWGRGLERATPGRVLTPRDWQDLTAAVRLDTLLPLRKGPTLETWSQAHRVWPVPRDAYYAFGKTHAQRQHPRPLSSLGQAVSMLDSREGPCSDALWWPVREDSNKPAKRTPSWWLEQAFIRWLRTDGSAEVDSAEVESAEVESAEVESAEVDSAEGMGRNRPAGGEASLAGLEGTGEMTRRRDVHVGIDPLTLSTLKGILFSSEVLEPLTRDGHEWALGLRVSVPGAPSPLLDHLWTLGGDQRLARPAPLAADVFAPPQSLLEAFARESPGLRLVVVSPANFRGWLPPGITLKNGRYRGRLHADLEEMILWSALSDRPHHVSGWDLTAGKKRGGQPKRTLQLIRPGAVYYVTKASGAPFTDKDAAKLWLMALGSGQEDGQGRVVPGLWTPGYPTTVDG